MRHDSLPPDVQAKLRDARRWLRSHDVRLAECLEAAEIRTGRPITVAAPDSAGRILVNPAALRSLPAHVVAGALLGSLLEAPSPACPEGAAPNDGGRGRGELWERVERIRRTLREG